MSPSTAPPIAGDERGRAVADGSRTARPGSRQARHEAPAGARRGDQARRRSGRSAPVRRRDRRHAAGHPRAGGDGAPDVTPTVAGVDIGGTKTLAVALGDDGHDRRHGAPPDGVGFGRRAARRPPPTCSTSLPATVDTARGRRIHVAIGVGIPGLIDRSTGSVRHAVNLALGDEPVELGAPPAPTRSVAPWRSTTTSTSPLSAPRRRSGGRGDLAYLSVGTGVAAGFLRRRPDPPRRARCGR